MDTFFATITWFGSLYLLLPSSALLCLVLFKTGRLRETVLLCASLATTTVAVHIVKLIIRRPRPEVSDPLVPMPSDWSFPSAHTAQATSFFLVLSLIAFRILPPAWALTTTCCGLMIVAGVGYSRIHLQVHHSSDVFAGVVLAVILVLLLHLTISHLSLRQDT